MKYALVRVLPEVPPGGVCAGIDWASADHAVCVADLAGRVTARAWILIIWRCWQDGTSYDPAKHRALQDILTRQAAAGTPQPHR